ncbi:MAG: GDP-mannose 4,6-dehydratase, partial [Candidatus Omnitrophica bacterium]|nr:GDP-mannose 4,6-dehydratase [Candidatus Omnitrophota bacterium]
KDKKAKFFLTSTSEIYGDPLVHPQPEEYWGNVNTIGVRSCYDESKRGAESLTYAYMRQHNVDVRVIRIFNTYGPNMQCDDGRVVSNFIVQALKGEDITLYGKGDQTRSFCYVDDLLEGIFKLMRYEYKMPLNLGNPFEFTILELVNLVLKLTNSKSGLKFLPLPDDDPKKRNPDITKAKKLLDWEPIISLEEGLKKTIEYFTKKLNL